MNDRVCHECGHVEPTPILPGRLLAEECPACAFRRGKDVGLKYGRIQGRREAFRDVRRWLPPDIVDHSIDRPWIAQIVALIEETEHE